MSTRVGPHAVLNKGIVVELWVQRTGAQILAWLSGFKFIFSSVGVRHELPYLSKHSQETTSTAFQVLLVTWLVLPRLTFRVRLVYLQFVDFNQYSSINRNLEDVSD